MLTELGATGDLKLSLAKTEWRFTRSQGALIFPGNAADGVCVPTVAGVGWGGTVGCSRRIMALFRMVDHFLASDVGAGVRGVEGAAIAAVVAVNEDSEPTDENHGERHGRQNSNSNRVVTRAIPRCVRDRVAWARLRKRRCIGFFNLCVCSSIVHAEISWIDD